MSSWTFYESNRTCSLAYMMIVITSVVMIRIGLHVHRWLLGRLSRLTPRGLSSRVVRGVSSRLLRTVAGRLPSRASRRPARGPS